MLVIASYFCLLYRRGNNFTWSSFAMLSSAPAQLPSNSFPKNSFPQEQPHPHNSSKWWELQRPQEPLKFRWLPHQLSNHLLSQWMSSKNMVKSVETLCSRFSKPTKSWLKHRVPSIEYFLQYFRSYICVWNRCSYAAIYCTQNCDKISTTMSLWRIPFIASKLHINFYWVCVTPFLNIHDDKLKFFAISCESCMIKHPINVGSSFLGFFKKMLEWVALGAKLTTKLSEL